MAEGKLRRVLIHTCDIRTAKLSSLHVEPFQGP